MATTTPNFGWPVPTSTDLVKDGAVAIEGLGDAIDASLLDLKGGTTGQVLAKASNTDMDFTWATDASGIPATIFDAKGDIIAATAADTASRLAVGANNTVLTADSSTATGLKWATPGGSSGPAFRAFRSTSNQSFGQSTWTKVQFNSESFDTANCFDSTTNYRFTPNVAGYYYLTAMVLYDNSGGTNRWLTSIWKNGTQTAHTGDIVNGSSSGGFSGSDLMYFNGTTDYAEIYGYAENSTTRNFYADSFATYFSGVWIRS